MPYIYPVPRIWMFNAYNLFTMSALPPEGDICECKCYVRFGPKADMPEIGGAKQTTSPGFPDFHP